MTSSTPKPTVGTVLFPGFELLDVFGPLDFFLILPDLFDFVMLAEKTGSVRSGQGPTALAERALSDCESVDILLVPGGKGTRTEVENPTLLCEIDRLSQTAQYVTTVCTGSALLAKTGQLDHKRATTNKAAWQWVTSQRSEVDWVAKARWVEDGKFFTSSGVSAGMDMALGLVQEIYGEKTAKEVALRAEYKWNNDSNDDPFAEIHGLV
ncbi:DJ-1/PfpI family protein [Puniceicoccus vermicola]|uniref:DJ-1/PfpI family protein n=1 Tax=Puniceicoccus vermicola TaxID=388746 RepID=A0A7X1AWJ7_9BACT|nr:DJ-1/PfpI family protein [Puniceicoccus vermicola]MBC2601316.1 DJ-1/PfpI family protein [Puniceicoccus vermicola]